VGGGRKRGLVEQADGVELQKSHTSGSNPSRVALLLKETVTHPPLPFAPPTQATTKARCRLQMWPSLPEQWFAPQMQSAFRCALTASDQ